MGPRREAAGNRLLARRGQPPLLMSKQWAVCMVARPPAVTNSTVSHPKWGTNFIYNTVAIKNMNIVHLFF